MILGITYDQLIFMAIMVIAVFLFMTEYLRVDVVAILIVLALSITGLLNAEEAFSGFSSEPAIIVAAVCVTIGSVASFLTPIGHHGNLLILSPGGYRFADFLKIGLPLTILLSLVTCFLALRIWSGG